MLDEYDEKATVVRVCPCGSRDWAGHFAAFPPALVRDFVKAGCPARVCSECGSPWHRVVKRGNSEHHCRPGCGCQEREGQLQNWEGGYDGYGGFENTAVDTGEFEPTCECGADTVPGIGLDIFAGSGTTLLELINQGRRAIGIELNEEYVAISEARIAIARSEFQAQMDI